MNEIFKYNSLNAYLKPSTKSLILSTKAQTHQQGLTLEWLFEVDSILQWAFDKIEIQSVLLTGDDHGFSPCLNKQDIALKEKEYWLKIHQKINALNKMLTKMPQTIILDCKDGSSNIGLDIAISADIILGHRCGQWNFNHLNFGFAPVALHLFGTQKIAPHLLDQWILSGSQISHVELLQQNIFCDLYDDTDRNHIIQATLDKIFHQAPVTRIQTKLALKRSFLERLDAQIQADQKIYAGTLMSEEWKLMPIQKSKNQDRKLPSYNRQNKNKTNNFASPNFDNVIPIKRDQ